MIHGHISPNLELIVPVYILDQNGFAYRLEAAIDTGFTGELSLPSYWIKRLGLVPWESLEFTLANAVTESFDSYYGYMLWHDTKVEVQVIEAEGTPLIGIGLLWDNLLTAAITDNGAVTIGPLAP